MQYQISLVSAFFLCSTRIHRERVYSCQVDCCLDKSVQVYALFLHRPCWAGAVSSSLIQDKKSILKYHHLSPNSNVIFSMHPQPLLVHESAVLGQWVECGGEVELCGAKIDRVALKLPLSLCSLSKTHQWPRLETLWSYVEEHDKTAVSVARQMMKYPHQCVQT